MPYPDSVPVFTKDMILIDPDNYEHKDGRKTTMGWLKELFLFSIIDKEHIWIEEGGQKIFKIVLDKFRKEVRIGVGESINHWEDGVDAKTQASCLNKVMRSLGYTQIEEK